MKTEESRMKEMYRETFVRVNTPEGVRSRILNTDVDAAEKELEKVDIQEEIIV